ncbi:bacillithiol system redox-active protein YtxJ [Muricauda sp. 2012CJ35-5]|uniref:Bacillithiol system redox-active protein YtxJ n=1 Tax=Flagellimonas spongiicola TaxID=2942208 RepID=A0ABT0PP25_9FLAO|nr:bacillithiol system redox-active protein YtxJ [Allomuricauda spongiicola]MCL6273120.1 bacillithiol system redox-active protein YtxJ [Allomuricauda spongiicola]
MGLFGNVFGKKESGEKKESKIPWVALESVDQLNQIEKDSSERTQVIFKHSTTCGISRMVLNMFTGSYVLGDSIDIYFLDLHAHRAVSNAVESKFLVRHQSPQLLILKNGEVTFHTSHGAIADLELAQLV